MANPEEVLRLLNRAHHQESLALAGMWGAVRGTAPADRWAHADAALVEASALITEARAELAAIDKQEAFCVTCGWPLISGMTGWKHWDTVREDTAEEVGHGPDLDWRPIREGGTDDK